MRPGNGGHASKPHFGHQSRWGRCEPNRSAVLSGPGKDESSQHTANQAEGLFVAATPNTMDHNSSALPFPRALLTWPCTLGGPA